ncbi:MAG: hypothetical protein KZQ64_01885 [gamma proteobacterium symbiont of Bathyaustriella thionipta]|nr:hypothetical protein [gamma proteobacterium symbiont of Bathyaustriella thionipta]MCU7949993.1 hypothetical protein [gamma proteobacterium symbiont of Bathyaustriella thionipta]MCU7952143.1 hypothetical protein [gamma proteobacterium symbiont of Bathyaustriella thionipta]MCU7956577.1 hypothetical protein [gamma proteobacterium symbiont of Bathyaustriella thionipta]MCU7967285.1 hypothetical protein [gamma proteobacterium symbiont of Bathyaustriella thionipta]
MPTMNTTDSVEKINQLKQEVFKLKLALTEKQEQLQECLNKHSPGKKILFRNSSLVY